MWDQHPYLAPPVEEEEDGAQPEDQDKTHDGQLLWLGGVPSRGGVPGGAGGVCAQVRVGVGVGGG